MSMDCRKYCPTAMFTTGASPGCARNIRQPKYAKYSAPSHCTAKKRAGAAVNKAATPATASHIKTWSPAMMPKVEAKPPRTPPLAVEVNNAKLPGPGIARKTTMASTNAA